MLMRLTLWFLQSSHQNKKTPNYDVWLSSSIFTGILRTAEGAREIGNAALVTTPTILCSKRKSTRPVTGWDYLRGSQKGLKVVPYSPELTKNYRCQIIVERTQDGRAVAYLMKYAFKLQSTADMCLYTTSKVNSISPNAARGNTRNDERV